MGKILAVSDISGGLYYSEGLDIPKLLNWTQDGNYLKDFKDKRYKLITNEEVNKIKHKIKGHPCFFSNSRPPDNNWRPLVITRGHQIT